MALSKLVAAITLERQHRAGVYRILRGVRNLRTYEFTHHVWTHHLTLHRRNTVLSGVWSIRSQLDGTRYCGMR